MAILWPRFIVLATLSIMFVLYYFLAKDEEGRMIRHYGDAYKEYMSKTGMFLPRIWKSRPQSGEPILSGGTKRAFAILTVVLVVIGSGFVCRYVTLHSLHLETRDNVTLLSIMPEDAGQQSVVLNAIQSDGIEFLNQERHYLGYEMPVDYIMQGMIANTGAEHRLYKQHHTVALIVDWVLHPFAHLRRSPSAHMAMARDMDPAMARRHHCPLGIDVQSMNCADCDYRRVIFVEVTSPSPRELSGKGVFSLDTTRTPVGFIDIDTQTGSILNMKRVEAKTAWSDVPTPAI